MSSAYRCDRCGDFYDGEVARPTTNWTGGYTRQINSIGNNFYDADLCQSCWNSFESWWNEVRKEKKK